MSNAATAEAPAEPKIEHILTVERGPLLQALTQVAPAAAARGSSLPILCGLRLTRVSKNQIRATAPDLDIEVSCTVAADCPKKFDVVVPSKLFRDMVREAAGTVTLSLGENPLSPDKDDIVVTWGRTVAIIKPYPVSEWPNMSTAEPTSTFELTAADVDRIRRIANFASTDDARPILTGICMDPKDGAVATDSYRLGLVDLEGTVSERFLMQARVARFLPMRLLDTETATVTIEGGTATAGAGYVRIECGEVTIRSCLIQGEFPPYDRLIPTGTPTTMTFNRADLRKALSTAKILCVDAIPVRIVVEDGKEASIRSVAQDVGQLATTVDILAHEGTLLQTCAFNVVYLGEMLGMLDAETVTLELTDALKPALAKDGPWTLLIMPVRVS